MYCTWTNLILTIYYKTNDNQVSSNVLQCMLRKTASDTNLNIINLSDTLVTQKFSTIFSFIHYLLILQRRTWADCMLTGSHLFGCDLYEWQLCPVPFCTQTLAEQLTLTGVLVFSTFSFPSRSLELFFVDVERSLSLLSPMWSRSFSLFLSFLFRLW